MICDFLIICEPDLNQEAVQEILNSKFYEALQNDLDEIDETILENCVEVAIFKMETFNISNDETTQHTLCCFNLNIPLEVENPQLVIEYFASLLESFEGIKHILKFYDDHLLENNLKFIPRLFELEMKLRKAISIIYLFSYYDDFYNLLRDDSIEVIKKDGNKVTEEQMKNMQENEFFHLTFSQYINLNKTKPIKDVNKLLSKMSLFSTFEDFKDGLQKLPIVKESFQDFIASLNQTLDAIEKLRNCIAHNRTPSKKIIEDFERFYVMADELIENFLISLTDEQEENSE